MFYRYSQINVNGCFLGPPIVIVEAANLAEAEVIAQCVGVYFDGVSTGRDCECCGDRWTRFAEEYARREDALASIPSDCESDGGSAVFLLVPRSAA